MTDEQRQLIHQSAGRLRSRLMFIMLCSHTLKHDLHDVLTQDNEREFQQMDRVLEETKAILNTLLRQLEPEPKTADAPKDDCPQCTGGWAETGDAAWELPARGPGNGAGVGSGFDRKEPSTAKAREGEVRKETRPDNEAHEVGQEKN